MYVVDMYITTLPIALSGILNMIFTKTNFYKNHKSPIDNGKILKDGKRLFGDNKTWVGFFSMIVFCIVTQVLSGLILNTFGLNYHNDIYNIYYNNFIYNVIIGSLFGLTYMILELPNSFIKRRINIEPGKTEQSLIGILFFIIDQIDSLIGVMFIIYIFSNISFLKYLCYITLGGLTHIIINLVLYKLKIRRNL